MLNDNVTLQVNVLNDYKDFTRDYIEELTNLGFGDSVKTLTGFLMTIRHDVRLHLIKSHDMVAELWNIVREEQICFDFTMELITHIRLKWSEELASLYPNAIDALSLQTNNINIDSDTYDRFLTKEEASELLKENEWILHLLNLKQIPLKYFLQWE